MATTFTPKPWEEVRDLVAGKESYDHDTIAYDRLEKDGSKRNLAGIVTPKPITQMQLGVLTDWQETEMRNKSRAYGLTLPGRQEELRRQGFKGDPGSTGVGRYQFERSTLIDTAKDLYGDGWKDVVFTPDEQEKLAKHLYTRAAARGPEALGNTWHALRNVDHGSPSTTSSSPIRLASAPKETSTLSTAAPLAAASALGIASGLLRTSVPGSPAESEYKDDIGTLGQYRGLYSLLSTRIRADRDKMRKKLALLRNKTRAIQNQEKLAENVRFKDLRKNIYEQIIMSESEEKIDEGVSQFFSLNPQSNQSLAQDAIEMGLGFIPGVGQALAARDFERARRVGDKAGMAMAASSVVPLTRVGNKSLEIIKRASKEAEDLFHAMKKTGVSDDDIWKSTHGKVPGGGVYQHPQTGDIVQEIPGTVKVKPEFRKNFEKTRELIQQFRNRRNYEIKKFGDVFDAPELYDQIPEIKNSEFGVNKLPEIIPNFISRRLSKGVYQPAWRSNPASMKASVGDTKDLEVLGSHEAAHYVADRNNLPRGSSSDFHAYNMNWDSMSRSQKASAISKKDSPFHRYERDPGEIDARVSSQRNLTPDEYRRNVNPRHDYADEYERTTGKPLITPFYKTKE